MTGLPRRSRADRLPRGRPQDILKGFIGRDNKAMGRPVGVAIDKSGALLVADDVGNVIWRVSRRKGDDPPHRMMAAEQSIPIG